MSSPLLKPLARSLFVGSLLLLGAASVHPMLHGSAAEQLAQIAGTPRWRTIHILLSLGTGLVIIGVWSRLLLAPDNLRTEFGIAVGLLALGELLNGVNIAFMTAAGTQLAQMERDTPGSATLLYQGIHPATLMTARLGSLLVAVSALLLFSLGKQDPREAGWVRWIALVAGVIGVLAVT
ncbi:MAG: hypothetical protein ACREMY_31870, partial [bacterium]